MGDSAVDYVDGYPRVRTVIVNICEACIKGEGQECHTPGCALFLHAVDLPIHEELLQDVTGGCADCCRIYHKHDESN